MKGDLSKAVIYGMKCKSTNKLYIGSTTQGLKTRVSKHKTDYRGHTGLNPVFRNYRSSFEVLQNDNYDIYEIEKYPCESKHDLDYRETLHILRARECVDTDCVNIRLPIIIKNPPPLDSF